MRCLILAGQSGPSTSPSGGFRHRAWVINSLSECVESPTPLDNTWQTQFANNHDIKYISIVKVSTILRPALETPGLVSPFTTTRCSSWGRASGKSQYQCNQKHNTALSPLLLACNVHLLHWYVPTLVCNQKDSHLRFRWAGTKSVSWNKSDGFLEGVSILLISIINHQTYKETNGKWRKVT